MIKYEKLPRDILSRIQNLKRMLMEDTNVVFAYLFGGLAKDGLKPLSDVDLAVYVCDMEKAADYKLRLFERATDSLGTNELDLVILNRAATSLAGRILQTKLVLVDKDPPLRHSYESLILREFFDFRVKEEQVLSRRYGTRRPIIDT